MSTQNKELMAEARKSLTGKWGLAIGGMVLYSLPFILLEIPSVLLEESAIVGSSNDLAFYSIIDFIISGPMILGFALFNLNISRGKEATVSQIFHGFNHFGRAFVTLLLMLVYIILWLLCFIIPGIIAGLSYTMTFYVLADDPTLSAKQAITASKQMMKGHKMKLFLLGFRFLGWALLAILTVGIGFLWLIPYFNITVAKFYDDIKPAPAEAVE